VGIDTEYDDASIVQTGEGRNNQSIIVDTGKHLAVVALCSALCGVAGALSIWAAYQANRSERESRMLQNYVIELDAKLIHAGFIEPKETWTVTKEQINERK
jgi:hypothetical protein